MQNSVRRPHAAAAVVRRPARPRLNPVELLMLGLLGTLVLDLTLIGWGITHGWMG